MGISNAVSSSNGLTVSGVSPYVPLQLGLAGLGLLLIFNHHEIIGSIMIAAFGVPAITGKSLIPVL